MGGGGAAFEVLKTGGSTPLQPYMLDQKAAARTKTIFLDCGMTADFWGTMGILAYGSKLFECLPKTKLYLFSFKNP